MNQENQLQIKADAMFVALEEYKTASAMTRSMSAVLSPALEGFSIRPGLEEEVVEKRKNVFVRIYDFFKNLFIRIKGWIEQRREKGREAWKAKENHEATKESMNVDPSEVQQAKKKAEAADVAAMQRNNASRQEDSAMKMMNALVSDAEKLLTDKEFLSTHFASMAKDYSGYYSLRSGDSSEFINKITHINSTLREIVTNLELAINHAKQGRQQAGTLIDRIVEQAGNLATESRELLTKYGQQSTVEIPNMHSLLEAATDSKLVGIVISQFEDNGHDKLFERIESDMGPLLYVFKQVAESDPDSLSGTASAIQEIGPNRLTALAQLPAYLMSAAGRVNTLGSVIIPSQAIDVKRIAEKAISVSANGKNIVGINEAAVLSLLEIMKNRYK